MTDTLDLELFQSSTEIMGVDSADFAMDNATYIRLQVVVGGAIKVIPMDLVQQIAKFITSYDIKKAIYEQKTNTK